MNDDICATEQDWRPIRPDVARDAEGATLLESPVRLQIVRVAPGGGFAPHVDAFGHLFHFLEGQGTLRVEDRTYAIRPGLTARVAAGQSHAYENTGETELRLISVNIPAT